MTTELVYKSKDLLCFYKEGGLATVPLKSKTEGDSLLKRISLSFPEVLTVRGLNSWEGGIIHRLDTPTSGLVLCARNDETYSSLIEEQKKDRIEKRYRAEVTEKDSLLPGFPPFPYFWNDEDIAISSFFRSYGPKGAKVRPTLYEKRSDSNVLYKTFVHKISPTLFECTIMRGFRHQIRCHLSWAGFPIIGDDKYNGEENSKLCLTSYSLSFVLKGERIKISL